MRVHVTTRQGESVQARIETSGLVSAESGATTETSATAPNPIAPESKELIWGGGSFLVFLVIMRLFLFPKLKKGMDARYDGIQSDLEEADATRLAAQSDVAQYQAALEKARIEAAGRVDAARQTLDQERNAKIAEANARIASKRSAAEAELNAARLAVRDQVAAAVASVTEHTTQLAVGKSPDAGVVRNAVQQVMQQGANS
jgi:F-type H+-transporting ATPase subunit b